MTALACLHLSSKRYPSINRPAQRLGCVGTTAEQTLSGTLSDVCLYFKCLVSNDHAGSPQNNCTMALSTTIIRFSPTPPAEPDVQSNLDLPKSLNQVPPQHSKSLDPLPAHHCKSPDPPRTGSALSCVRSQSECNFHHPQDTTDGSAGCRNPQHPSDSGGRQLTKVDSGYSSNLNIQHASGSTAPQNSQQWERPSSVSSSAYVGGLGIPPSYSTEGLHYVPIPNFKATGLIDLPHQGDMQSLLAPRPLFTSQLAQQYLAPEAPLHPGAYHAGTMGNGLFSVASAGMSFLSTFIAHYVLYNLLLDSKMSMTMFSPTWTFFKACPATLLQSTFHPHQVLLGSLGLITSPDLTRPSRI